MISRFLALCRKNLFASWVDGVLSILTLSVVLGLLYSLTYWALALADWSVVTQSLRFMMTGSLGLDDLWRAWLASGVFFLLVGASLARITRARSLKTIVILGPVLIVIAATFWAADYQSAALAVALMLAAACGGAIGVRFTFGGMRLSLAWVAGILIMWNLLVPSAGHAVGGLLLSVLVTLVAAVVSFPLGVGLALGRSSRLPGVRLVCAGYIELVRSLPLISILYWAWLVVPLILSSEYRINDLVRGATGITLFYAAYVAEYIRGGLQAIPVGQWNAARSLGLRKFDTLYHIILPQAIRAVLPGLVGNVLDIFNNVPLLFIIGLTEFIRAGQVILSNPQHSNQLYEVYAFMFAVYLIIATVLSWSSRVVERSLSKAD